MRDSMHISDHVHFALDLHLHFEAQEKNAGLFLRISESQSAEKTARSDHR